MDENLKKALDFSNYQIALSNQRKVIREKAESKLAFGHSGGIFKIDRSLLTFVQMLIDSGRNIDVPMIDINENPILIKDLESFRDEIFDRYFSVNLEYYNEFQEIKKSRTVEKLISYE